jgi:hypothetical protein
MNIDKNIWLPIVFLCQKTPKNYIKIEILSIYYIIPRIKSYDDDRLSKTHLPITLLDISTIPSKMGQMSGQPLKCVNDINLLEESLFY